MKEKREEKEEKRKRKREGSQYILLNWISSGETKRKERRKERET